MEGLEGGHRSQPHSEFDAHLFKRQAQQTLILRSMNESRPSSGTILPALLPSKWKDENFKSEFYGADFKSAQKKPRKKALQIKVLCSVKNSWWEKGMKAGNVYQAHEETSAERPAGCF